MKRFVTRGLFLVCACLASVETFAQIIVVNDSTGDGISDGGRELLPGTAGQTLSFYVTGGASVEGLDFKIQIGDGNGGAGVPVITDVDITGNSPSPTIFSGNNTGRGVARSDPGIWSTSTTTAGGSVSASGLLARVTFSTVGVTSGTWTLALKVTQEGTTDFGTTPATITDGTISVVPEPNAQMLVAGVLGVAALVWRFKRSKAA